MNSTLYSSCFRELLPLIIEQSRITREKTFKDSCLDQVCLWGYLVGIVWIIWKETTHPLLVAPSTQKGERVKKIGIRITMHALFHSSLLPDCQHTVVGYLLFPSPSFPCHYRHHIISGTIRSNKSFLLVSFVKIFYHSNWNKANIGCKLMFIADTTTVWRNSTKLYSVKDLL